MLCSAQLASLCDGVCVCGGQDFVQRAGLEDDLSDLCLKLGLDLLLLMTISFTHSQEPIRELAVFSASAACREEVPPWRSSSTPQKGVAMTTVLCPRPAGTWKGPRTGPSVFVQSAACIHTSELITKVTACPGSRVSSRTRCRLLGYRRPRSSSQETRWCPVRSSSHCLKTS